MHTDTGDTPQADLHQVATCERHEGGHQPHRRHQSEGGELHEHEGRDERVAEYRADRSCTTEEHRSTMHLRCCPTGDQRSDRDTQHDERCFRPEDETEDQCPECGKQGCGHHAHIHFEVESIKWTRCQPAGTTPSEPHHHTTRREYAGDPPDRHLIPSGGLRQILEEEYLPAFDRPQEHRADRRCCQAEDHRQGEDLQEVTWRIQTPPPGPALPILWTRMPFVVPGTPGGTPATMTTRSPAVARPISSRALSTWRTMSSVC